MAVTTNGRDEAQACGCQQRSSPCSCQALLGRLPQCPESGPPPLPVMPLSVLPRRGTSKCPSLETHGQGGRRPLPRLRRRGPGGGADPQARGRWPGWRTGARGRAQGGGTATGSCLQDSGLEGIRRQGGHGALALPTGHRHCPQGAGTAHRRWHCPQGAGTAHGRRHCPQGAGTAHGHLPCSTQALQLRQQHCPACSGRRQAIWSL